MRFKPLISTLSLLVTTFLLPVSAYAQDDNSNSGQAPTYDVTNKTFYDVFYDTVEELGLDANQISIALYDFEADEHYYINENRVMLGASTTKVGTAAIFTDLVNQGDLTFDSPIPYNQAMYEAGGGEVTNNPPQDAYALEDLIYQMLYHSDNTAWNLLTNYYYTYYGNYQEALLYLSGAPIIDDSMYQFNHVTAQVLEGILIHIASNPGYETMIQTMKDAQTAWLLKAYMPADPEGAMASKYGYLENYFHDMGIYYHQDQPVYALVVMTDGLPLEYLGVENEFFGYLNVRYHDWVQSSDIIAKTQSSSN
ncbi:TPA: serine hydrolase [Streptococcus suis]